jgi:hypothetical protein
MSSPIRPEVERWLASQPGVGAGFLDTLRALHGSPLAFDTASAAPHAYGQYQAPGRVVINPAAENLEGQLPRTLAHEAFGHGVMGADEERAEDAARALMLMSGRHTPAAPSAAMQSRALAALARLRDEQR